jgi:hypothetical protein
MVRPRGPRLPGNKGKPPHLSIQGAITALLMCLLAIQHANAVAPHKGRSPKRRPQAQPAAMPVNIARETAIFHPL